MSEKKGDLYKNKYRIESTRLKYWDYGQNGYYFVTICIDDREYYFGDVVNAKMELSPIGMIVEKYWTEIPKHFNNVILDEFVVMPNHVHGIIVIDNEKCNDVPDTTEPVFAVTHTDVRDVPDVTHGSDVNGVPAVPPISDAVETGHCPVSTMAPDTVVGTSEPGTVETSELDGKKRHFRYQNPGKKSLSTIIGSFKSICSRTIHKSFPNVKFIWQERFHDRILRNEIQTNIKRGYIRTNPERWERDRNNKKNYPKRSANIKN